jgi:hypothetical protein
LLKAGELGDRLERSDTRYTDIPPPGGKPMERDAILLTLRRDAETAKEKLAAATEKFDAMMRESPSALPHPDGVQRIHNAAKALSIARQEHVEAFVRLNAFVAEGIIPDNLRNGAGHEEELGKVKIESSGQ